MKSIRKSRFFLPIAIALAVAGTLVCLNVNSPQASALSGCSQRGASTVSLVNQNTFHYWGTYPYYQPLSWGSKNECVRSLQNMANVYCTADTRLNPDADFGRRTYSAVKSIQHHFATQGLWGGYYQIRINNSPIGVDGQVGPQTWALLQAFSYLGSPAGGNVNCRAFMYS